MEQGQVAVTEKPGYSSQILPAREEVGTQHSLVINVGGFRRSKKFLLTSQKRSVGLTSLNVFPLDFSYCPARWGDCQVCLLELCVCRLRDHSAIRPEKSNVFD